MLLKGPAFRLQKSNYSDLERLPEAMAVLYDNEQPTDGELIFNLAAPNAS